MQLINYTRSLSTPSNPNSHAIPNVWTLSAATSPNRGVGALSDFAGRNGAAFAPVVPEPKDVCSRFGRRLKALRQQRSMTQSDMAKKFGIDRSFISDVERGRKSISLHTLEVIAIGMGVSLSKLFEDI